MTAPIHAIVDRIPLVDDIPYDLHVLGNVLYTANGPIRRIDLDTKQITIIAPAERSGPMAFVDYHRPLDGPEDGGLIGTGLPDQRLYFVLPERNRILEVVPPRLDLYRDIQILPEHLTSFFALTMVGTNHEAKYLYFFDVNRYAICVVDLKVGKMVGSIQLGNFSWDIAISPDDQTLYAAQAYENCVAVIDLTTSPPSQKAVRVTNGPAAVALSSDGQRLFVACCGDSGGAPGELDHGTLSVFDTSTWQEQQVPVGKYSLHVVVNNAGTRAYVSNARSNSISVVDCVGGLEVIATITGFDEPARMCLSPDEMRLFVAEGTPSVAVVAI
ncbi:YncE family protein [Mycobacterium sp. ITM-2016-00316]|uniref:YncE family protein n=1 Tax=Mycobacterium sp. ITM-2016-00316 TaxID=2099695 RepID=UPI000CF98F53|nr:YncE family protein [Mycobacterium sp. ITM-2016-00316]WNG83016.1 YncE family protein [Mycobacterium sp. ITM-2016-00316]